MDKEQKKWMFILVILILLLLNLAVFINWIKLINGDQTATSSNNNEVTTAATNDTKNELEQHIAKQEENVRVQYYVANFLGLIEGQNYDEAYNRLNDDFKKTNFDTVEKFKEFCKIYPTKNGVCQYSDFDRIGSSVYVITATIKQLDSTKYKAVKQTFVVRENGYNDYKISLQMDYSYVNE